MRETRKIENTRKTTKTVEDWRNYERTKMKMSDKTE